MLCFLSEPIAEATFTGSENTPGDMNANNNWNYYIFGRTHNTGVKELMAGTQGKTVVLPPSPWPHNPQGRISCEEHSDSVWKDKQLTTGSIYCSLSSRCWRAHCPFVGHGNGIMDSGALSSGNPGRCAHLPRNHGPEKRGMEGMGIRE